MNVDISISVACLVGFSYSQSECAFNLWRIQRNARKNKCGTKRIFKI